MINPRVLYETVKVATKAGAKLRIFTSFGVLEGLIADSPGSESAAVKELQAARASLGTGEVASMLLLEKVFVQTTAGKSFNATNMVLSVDSIEAVVIEEASEHSPVRSW